MKVIIVGAGKLGYKLAEAMNNESIEVTLMDMNTKPIDRVKDHLDILTVIGNGLEVGILRDLGIEKYSLLIAATGSDETNTIICKIAKKLGCEQTIARIRNPEYSEQLDFIKAEMGIDYIINPDFNTARDISRILLKNYNVYAAEFARGKVLMVDVHMDHLKNFIGMKISDIKGFSGLIISAISRDGLIIIPNGSTVLKADDLLYILGKHHTIRELKDRLNLNKERKQVKKVMILGGGKIGYYLAKRLLEVHASVTIIEENRERCKYLTEKLNTQLIIHGDGTDINLLEEENLSKMDAFVSATGYDEQNLLMAITAKQMGVPKVIAKISRPSYANIVDKLDIDYAINPINITTSDVLKFVRGGKVVSVSLLLGGQAEVTEIIIDDHLEIIDKPIKELGLPKGILIGAIVHQSQVLIPNGETIIHRKDRLIIFCLSKDVSALEQFIKPSKGGRLSELWNRSQGIRRFINH